MPSYIVTMKDDASDEDLKAAKALARSQGGVITHEYTLMKSFSVEIPEGTVTTLASHEQVQAVELDKLVTTQ